jgi:hypothetical protein
MQDDSLIFHQAAESQRKCNCSARYAHSAVRGANLSEETPPGTAA